MILYQRCAGSCIRERARIARVSVETMMMTVPSASCVWNSTLRSRNWNKNFRIRFMRTASRTTQVRVCRARKKYLRNKSISLLISPHTLATDDHETISHHVICPWHSQCHRSPRNRNKKYNNYKRSDLKIKVELLVRRVARQFSGIVRV